MPFSSESGKNYTTKVISKIKNGLKDQAFTVLDIGPGSGTYSNLYKKTLPGMWVGVEIWEPYVEKYQLREKYDTIKIADARDYVKNLTSKIDITFLGDVVEHMTKEESMEMVEKILSLSKFVIISIPIIHYPQGEFDGNPYEAHVKDDWSDIEVKETWGNKIIGSSVENEIGVYVLSNDPSLAQMLKVKIAVYGIFKNEAKFAGRFMESLTATGDCPDEVVLCDTGSNDGTADIMRLIWNQNSVGTKDSKLVIENIFVQPWRFDDARNTALNFVSPDVDVCVSIDIDEYLPRGWLTRLRDSYDPIVTRYYHKFCTFWDDNNPDNKSEHWHDRIHQRSNYKWWLPVHEILEPYNMKETVKWLPDFWMFQKPDTSKPRSSYLPLLEVSVRERPDVWKSWSFLASEYSQRGEKQKAFEAINRSLEVNGCDKAFLYNFRSNLHYWNGSFDDAFADLRRATNEAPNQREYFVYLAELYEKEFYRTNNPTMIMMANSYIDIASGLTNRSSGYGHNPAVWDNAFETIVKRIKDKKNETQA